MTNPNIAKQIRSVTGMKTVFITTTTVFVAMTTAFMVNIPDTSQQ